MKFQLPAYEEIPDLGLYLDQVSNYINRWIEPISHTTITNSMISNYVKKGIIDNPIKKLYYRDQIAYLLYVSLAKQVISLENMKLQFDILRAHYNGERAYKYFCNEFQNAIEYAFKEKESMDSVSDDFSNGRLLLKNSILAIANYLYLSYCFEQLREEKLYKVYQNQ